MMDESLLTLRPTKRLGTRQKILLSFACLPTNLGWALSESLIIPYLLIIGAPLYVCSWTWFFSPILASYLAPKMDQICDDWNRANCWGWRGRKKCVLALAVTAAITMVLLPQSHTITTTVFRSDSVALTFVVAMSIFTVMDVSFYLLLRPLAALIWDIALGDKDIYMDTMKVFNVVQGVCRMSGLLIVAFCISFDFVFVGTHIGSAFTLGAIINVVFTFFSLFYSPNPPEIETVNPDCDALSVISEALPFANSGYSSNLFSTLEQDLESMDNDEMKHLLELSHNDSAHSNVEVYQSTMMAEDEYETDEDDLTTPVADRGSQTHHKALSLLWVSQLLGWCSMCSVVLFWTSFISIDIYEGVPEPEDPAMAYQWTQFKAGLVFGAYGLLLTALVSVNCSVLYPWLRKRVSTRTLYLVGESMMASLCVMFFVTTNETWLLVLISAFGFVMQIHMQSCHELTENELQPMFASIRDSKTKNYFVYFMELANVIAPVAVSLFAGPVVEAFDGEFKYLFLMAGSIQLVLDFVVLLMFSNLFFWKLPRAPTSL